jgi:hypothetical protein
VRIRWRLSARVLRGLRTGRYTLQATAGPSADRLAPDRLERTLELTGRPRR